MGSFMDHTNTMNFYATVSIPILPWYMSRISLLLGQRTLYSSLIPRSQLLWTGENWAWCTLSDHAHQLPRILVIWIFSLFSTSLHYGWWQLQNRESHCLQLVELGMYLLGSWKTTSASTTWHPITSFTLQYTSLLHVIRRACRQCGPGPVFSPSHLKEKTGTWEQGYLYSCQLSSLHPCQVLVILTTPLRRAASSLSEGGYSCN